MTPRTRTTLALLLALPLAAVLLAAFACLPAPVGDAEKSKVDPALVGLYRMIPRDAADKGLSLASMQAWDGKTYLLTFYTVEKGDKKDDLSLASYKGWLTDIGGKTFLTCQPMDDVATPLGDAAPKAFWAVFRLDKGSTGDMEALMVSADSEYIKGLTKKEDIEAAIKQHVTDKNLYSEPLTFKKLGKNDKEFVADVLGRFNSKK